MPPDNKRKNKNNNNSCRHNQFCESSRDFHESIMYSTWAVALTECQWLHSDVTVSCSDVRVAAEWRAVSTHTADVSRSSDVERRLRGRARRAVASTCSALRLAPAVLTDCRPTVTGRIGTGCTAATHDDHSPTRRGMSAVDNSVHH